MAVETSLAVDSEDGGVTFALTARNTGAEPVELSFTSGQRAEFVVTDGDEDVWRYGEDRLFTMAIETETVPPGEAVTVAVTWEEPSPGDYEVEAWLTAAGEPAATATFNVG